MKIMKIITVVALLIFGSHYQLNAQYSGSYTINNSASASSTNFISLESAMDSLQLHGVSGPVEFEIIDTMNAYIESADVTSGISGSSSVNTISFVNSSLNNRRARIRATPTYIGLMTFSECSYISFEGLHFILTDQNQFVLYLNNKNHHISFLNDSFSCNQDFSSSLSFSAIDGGLVDTVKQHHITIDSCSFYNVPLVFNLSSSSSGSYYYSNAFRNNKVINSVRAVGVYYQQGFEAIGNEFYHDSTFRYKGMSPLDFFYSRNSKITNNEIRSSINGWSQGIKITGEFQVNSGLSLCANNFIYIKQNLDSIFNLSYAVFLNNCEEIAFYHNTISMSSNFGSALRIQLDSNSTGVVIRNNNVDVSGESKIMSIEDSDTSLNSNYNNFYHSAIDTSITYNGLSLDWSQYINTTNQDTNSFSVNPFLYEGSFFPRAFELDSAGEQQSLISHDIIGGSRTGNPDIGAVEFKAAEIALGLDTILNSVFCSDTADIQVVMHNYGLDSVFDADLLWYVKTDSVWTLVDTVEWTGSLGKGDTTSYLVGKYSASHDQVFRFKFSVENINGLADTLKINNPYHTKTFINRLSGSYTVGGSGSYYPDLDSALKDLELRGICSSVELLLKPGVYQGPFYLREYAGLNENDSIVIRSENSINPAVIMPDDLDLTTQSYGLIFQNTHDITIRNLVFSDSASSMNYTGVLFDSLNQRIRLDSLEFRVTKPANREGLVRNSEIGQLESFQFSNSQFLELGEFTGIYKSIKIVENDQEQQHSDFKIIGNKFNSTRDVNIELESIYNLDFIGNTVSSDTSTLEATGNGQYCIFIHDVSNVNFSKNSIHTADANACRLWIDGQAGKPSIISNNELEVNAIQRENNVGLSVNGSHLQVLHNSVALWGIDALSFSGSINGDSAIQVTGNSFVNYANGIAAGLDTPAISNLSFNNFYSEGVYVLRTSFYNTDGIQLQESHEEMDLDSAFNLDPYYRFGHPLRSTNIGLLGQVVRIPILNEDILGINRDSLTDIGAYEVDLLNNNLTILGYDANAFCETPFLKVKLRNEGDDTIISFQGHFSLDSGSVSSYYTDTIQWTGILPPSSEVLVDLGYVNFNPATLNRIQCEIDSVNGEVDLDTFQNRIRTPWFQIALNGNYTVGASTDDFITLDEAVLALHEQGVCGPVRFLLRDSIYNTAITIEGVKGASSTNTIQFTSHPNNSSRPKLVYNARNALSRAIIYLDGAHHVSFDSINIYNEDSLSSFTSIVLFNGHCHGISFNEDSLFDYKFGLADAWTRGNRSHFRLVENANNSVSNLEIHSCYFQDGFNAIQFPKEDYGEPLDSIKISSSTFDDVYQGVVFYFTREIELTDNYFNIKQSPFNPRAIELESDLSRIERNRVHIQIHDSTNRFFNALRVVGKHDSIFKTNRADIYNNMISINGEGDMYGDAIRISDIGVRLIHNTIYLNAESSGIVTALNFDAGSTVLDREIMIYNNNIVGNASSRIFYFGDDIPIDSSNYNNLFTESTTFSEGYYDFENFEDYRDSLSIDFNSISVATEFVSSTELRTSNFMINRGAIPISYVSIDIDQENRDLVRPDIGADEFKRPDYKLDLLEIATEAFCEDSVEILVKMLYSGEKHLNSCQFILEHQKGSGAIDTLSTTKYTGLLSSNDTVVISVGKSFFTADSLHYIRVSIDSINGEKYLDSVMNSLSKDSILTAMGGTYTVGSGSDDYSSLVDIATELNRRGLCGPVRVLLRDTVFFEQFSLNTIAGSSISNTIEFVSHPDNDSLPTLTFDWDSSSLKHIVALNSASNIIFDSLKFHATGSPISLACIFLDGDNHNVEITNSYFIQYNSSFTYAAIDHAQGNGGNSSLKIKGNKFYGDNTAVYITNQNLNSGDSVTVDSNYFEGWSQAINLTNISSATCTNNNLQSQNMTNNTEAVKLLSCNSSVVRSNTIFLSGDRILRGVRFNHRNQDFKGEFSNNMITVLRSTTNNSPVFSYDLDVLGELVVAHNSSYISQNDSNYISASIFCADTPISVQHFNNSYYQERNRGRLLAIYVSDNIQSDYNNYYGGKLLTISYMGSYYSLQNFKNSTSLDQNSISGDPEHFSSSDLHSLSPHLSNAGRPFYNKVKFDIDGDLRDSTRPDIGADEYVYYPRELLLVEDTRSYCTGNQTITVSVENVASQTIQKLHLRWRYKEGSNPFSSWMDTTWTGSIPQSDVESIGVGIVNIGSSALYKIEVEVDSINGTDKFQKRNNSLQFEIESSLGGIYTIGSGANDFDDFTEAIDAMKERGICGPVEFRVKQGSYYEFFTLDSIQGNSDTNTISFIAKPSNVNPVRVRYSPSVSNSQIVTIRSMHGVSFEGIDFENFSTRNGTIVSLQGVNNGIRFRNCKFLRDVGQSGKKTIIEELDNSSPHNVHNFTIDSCEFRGGTDAIILGHLASGNSNSNNITIRKSVISNWMKSGITINSCDSVHIIGNRVLNDSLSNGLRTAVYVSECFGGSFQNNQVWVKATYQTYGVELLSVSGTASNPFLVYNNFISVENEPLYNGSHNGAGLFLDSDVDYTSIFHNTIRAYGWRSQIAAFMHEVTNMSQEVEMMNNAFVAKLYANAIIGPSSSLGIESDYNLLYAEGVPLAKWRGNQYTLTQLQSRNTDEHSVFAEPEFVSDIDLHILNNSVYQKANPISGLSKDIDLEDRDTTLPDIGADEIEIDTRDIAIYEVIHDFSYCSKSISPIQVVLQNRSTISETNISIHIVLEGPDSSEYTYLYSDTLDALALDTILVDTVSFISSGQYSLTISCNNTFNSISSNDTFNHSWEVLPLITDSIPDVVRCGNEVSGLTLSAPEGYYQYEWYASETSTTVLSDSQIYQPQNLTQSDSFYVWFDRSKQRKLGPSRPASLAHVFPIVEGLSFHVDTTIRIDSITVYPKTDGYVVINIRDSADGTIFTNKYLVDGSTELQLPLFVTLEPGKYTIDPEGSNTQYLGSGSQNTSYPYRDTLNHISIDSSTLYSTSQYLFFYDWIVSNPNCNNSRLKARAIIKDYPKPAVFEVDTVCQGEATTIVYQRNNAEVLWFSSITNKLLSKSDTFRTQVLQSNNVVFVEIDSSNGCTSSRTSAVTIVKDKPSPSLLTDTALCVGEEFKLSARTQEVLLIRKAENDTAFFVGQDFSFQVANTDSFWLNSDLDGCESDISKLVVQAKQFPILPEIIGDTIVCLNKNLVLRTSPNRVLNWNYNSGTKVETDSVLEIVSPILGNHFIEYNLDSLGCVSDSSFEFEVIRSAIMPQPLSDSACPGASEEYTFNISSQTLWYSDTTTLPEFIGDTLVLEDISSDQIWYVKASNFGCVSDWTSLEIVVDSSLNPTLNTLISDTACIGTEAIGIATATDAAVVWYSAKDDTSTLAQNDSFSISAVDDSKWYYVRAHMSGCSSDFDSVYLKINELPDATFEYKLIDLDFHFNANTRSSDYYYNWEFPDQTITDVDSVVWRPITSDTSDFKLIVQDLMTGCVDSSSQRIYTRTSVIVSTLDPNGVKLFPNPNKNQFEIQLLENLQAAPYQVIDNFGKVVDEGRLDASGRAIVEHNFAAGTYIVKVDTDQGTYLIKVLIF